MMRILTHVVFRIVMGYTYNVHNISHQRAMAMILVILSVFLWICRRCLWVLVFLLQLSALYCGMTAIRTVIPTFCEKKQMSFFDDRQKLMMLTKTLMCKMSIL